MFDWTNDSRMVCSYGVVVSCGRVVRTCTRNMLEHRNDSSATAPVADEQKRAKNTRIQVCVLVTHPHVLKRQRAGA